MPFLNLKFRKSERKYDFERVILFTLLPLLLLWKSYSVFGVLGDQFNWSLVDYFLCFIQDILVWCALYLFWKYIISRYKRISLILTVFLCNLILLGQMFDGRIKILFMQPLSKGLIYFSLQESSILIKQIGLFIGKRYWVGAVLSLIILNIFPISIKLIPKIWINKLHNLNRLQNKATKFMLPLLVLVLIIISFLAPAKPYGLEKNFLGNFILPDKTVPGHYNYKNLSSEQPVRKSSLEDFEYANNKSIAVGKDWNVVFYIIESAAYDKSLGSKKDIMPFLKSLEEEGAIIQPCYAQSTDSAKSVFSIHTGMYSSPVIETLESQIQNISGIVSTLKSKGYYTAFITPQNLAYQSQRVQFANMGFDLIQEFTDLERIAKLSGQDVINTGFGAADDKAMLLAKLDELSKKQPFLVTYYTSSSHYPYYSPNSKGTNDFERYQKSLNYTDLVFQQLVEQYKKKGFFENTLFVIISDHGEEFQNGEFIGRHTSLSEAAHKIPLVIYAPNKNLTEPLTKCRHVDIMPTVLDILGLKEEGIPLQGKSLFRNVSDPPIFLNTYSSTIKSVALIENNTKYIHSFDTGQTWSVDLNKDPTGKDLSLVNEPNAKNYIKRLTEFNIYNEAHLRDLASGKETLS